MSLLIFYKYLYIMEYNVKGVLFLPLSIFCHLTNITYLLFVGRTDSVVEVFASSSFLSLHFLLLLLWRDVYHSLSFFVFFSTWERLPC